MGLCLHHAQLLPHPLKQVQLCPLLHKHAAATKSENAKQVFRSAIPHTTVRSLPTANRHFCCAVPQSKLIYLTEYTSNVQ